MCHCDSGRRCVNSNNAYLPAQEKVLKTAGGCAIVNWFLWSTDFRNIMERYRSGHNEAVLKTVCPQGHKGSNPFRSALKSPGAGGHVKSSCKLFKRQISSDRNVAYGICLFLCKKVLQFRHCQSHGTHGDSRAGTTTIIAAGDSDFWLYTDWHRLC